MKGFMQWFKSSNKMKRWMLLILVGMVLICYGIAEILVSKELSFQELTKIIVTFVLGVLTTVVGLVFLNKRTLEVLIEETDDRMQNKSNVNVNSLIFNKKIYKQGPKIVVIGGGTGLNTVLAGLKKYTDNLTAIVTVSDYGEPSSESRRELKLKPLDDIKDSIIALSNYEDETKKLLNYKVKEGKLKNLKFSDLYFYSMSNIYSEFTDSIANSNKIFNITGQVLPVTLDEMNITAELENGYEVTEKSKIAEITYNNVTKINRIYLKPSNCIPAPGVIDAIKDADCIIIGPGSLYTNVIPNLLVVGVAKAIKESTALKIYISNIMTEPGQTDEYTVADHVNAIIEHCGKGIIDYCIYDTGEIVPEMIKKYNLEGQDLVLPEHDNIKGIKFIQKNLATVSNGHIRHDPSLVAQAVISLICDDLQYQDKQNDPEYLMLNNKLKEDKRVEKIKRRMKKENKHPKKIKKEKSNSKFSSKYGNRIDAIIESNDVQKVKEKKLKRDEKIARVAKKRAVERQRLETMHSKDVEK